MLIVLPGRATRNFLLILCVMHVMLFVDRVNLAAAAETIKADLGLTNVQLGIAFSAFNYAYAPFQLVGGWIADRYGSRRTLAVCALAWALTTMATGAVRRPRDAVCGALLPGDGRRRDVAGGDAGAG